MCMRELETQYRHLQDVTRPLVESLKRFNTLIKISLLTLLPITATGLTALGAKQMWEAGLPMAVTAIPLVVLTLLAGRVAVVWTLGTAQYIKEEIQ